ncbi:hypothetical protein QOT17_016346 [Balamuthia mandrillaris]
METGVGHRRNARHGTKSSDEEDLSPREHRSLLGCASSLPSTINAKERDTQEAQSVETLLNGLDEGTLVFTVLEAYNLANVNWLGGGSDPYVLVGTYAHPLSSDLYKRAAPSPSLAKTTVVSNNAKEPRWNQELTLKLNKEVLRKKAGLHVQVWAFQTWSRDTFLGEVVLPWKDVMALCDNSRQKTTLHTRSWKQTSSRQQEEEDKYVQGSLSFRLSFRPTCFQDFKGVLAVGSTTATSGRG